MLIFNLFLNYILSAGFRLMPWIDQITNKTCPVNLKRIGALDFEYQKGFHKR